MPVPALLLSFWCGFANVDNRFYEAFYFGDSEALANELADLVLRGVKRATAAAAWTFEAQGKPLPKPGDLSIVTNWAGEPLCVIETLSVDIMPFRDVTAAFAAAEGEGDGSLAFWREAHSAYFTHECARAARAFSDDMAVACERFRVVYRPSVQPLDGCLSETRLPSGSSAVARKP